MERQKGIAFDKLILGIFLLGVGVAAYLGSIDVWEPRSIVRYWPVFLIVIGLANEVEALRKRKSDGGYVILAVGVWMLFGSLHLFGLSFGGAMAVGVVVIGLGMIVHAIVDRPTTATREEENDNV